MAISAINTSLTVTPDKASTRLDRFLAEQVTMISRTQIQKHIRQGEITVNEKSVPAHYALQAGDRVAIHTQSRPTATPERWSDIRVVAETADYIVVDKPAGVLVHPTPSSNELTLVDWIVEQYPEIKHVGDVQSRFRINAEREPGRPGIVHRLDRGVSGLLVIARTPESFTALKAQFQARTVEKTYAALVHGQIKEDGVIDLPISRSRSDGKRMAARPGPDGRTALTRYCVDRTFPNFTLLRVSPATGRMHQIRVHLRAIGHPIAGDQLYASRAHKPAALDRPFLHATEVAFTDQSGIRRSFASRLPVELDRFLAGLDGRAVRR